MPAVSLALLVVLISYRVLPNYGVITHGDVPFYWPNRAYDGFSAVGASFLGNIRVLNMSPALLSQLPRVLTLALPDSVTSYLLTYGPMYVAALVFYATVRRLTGNRSAAYLAALFITVNTVVIQHLAFGLSHIFPALTVYALTTCIYLGTTKALRAKHGLAIGLLTLAIPHPFLWALELSLVLLLWLYCAASGRRAAVATITALASSTAIAAYWLVPLLGGSLSSSPDDLYAGNQEAVFQGLRELVDYRMAFGLSEYPGAWSADLYGGRLPTAFYLSLLGLLVGTYIWRGWTSRWRRELLFLLALFVVALTLGLGPNSVITGKAWLALYTRLPVFGFFRTFTRPLTLALLALALALSIAVQVLHEYRPRATRLVVGATAVALLGSQWVVLTGDLNGTINATEIPAEYSALNTTLRQYGTDFSVVTFPQVGYEAYDWSLNRNYKAFQQIVYFKEFYLEKPVVFNRFAYTNFGVKNRAFERLFAFDRTFKFYRSLDADLATLDARFVLVHKDLVDIVGASHGRQRQTTRDAIRLTAVPFAAYVAYFSANPRYRKVDDNARFTLFENLAYGPRLRAMSADYQKLSDSLYRVHLRAVSTTRTVQLLQKFDAGWELYVDPVTGFRCIPEETFSNGLRQCADVKRSRLWPHIAPPETALALTADHRIALGYANSWSIKPNEIRALPRNYFAENADGSVDVTLLAYFRPQVIFGWGLTITYASLLLLVGVLLYLQVARRRGCTSPPAKQPHSQKPSRTTSPIVREAHTGPRAAVQGTVLGLLVFSLLLVADQGLALAASLGVTVAVVVAGMNGRLWLAAAVVALTVAALVAAVAPSTQVTETIARLAYLQLTVGLALEIRATRWRCPGKHTQRVDGGGRQG